MISLVLALVLGCSTPDAPPPGAEGAPQAGPDGVPVQPGAAQPPPPDGPPDPGDGPDGPPDPRGPADGEGCGPDGCPDAQLFQRCEGGPSPGCFVEIPGTTFLMGAQADDPDGPNHDPFAQPHEAPPHKVTVRSFAIQATEVPVGMYAECLASGACTGSLPEPRPADDLPATRLTWDEAGRLCRFLGGRLPTEAEWELAARGGDGRRFAWGDNPRCAHLTQAEEDALLAHRDALLARCGPFGTRFIALVTGRELELTAAAVDLWDEADMDAFCEGMEGKEGQALHDWGMARIRDTHARAAASDTLPECALAELNLVAGEYGDHPFDMDWMSGNAAEWVDDGYDPKYYSHSADMDPTAPPQPDGRYVLRGGSVLSLDASEWRTTARAAMRGDLATRDTSVRCVREVKP